MSDQFAPNYLTDEDMLDSKQVGVGFFTDAEMLNSQPPSLPQAKAPIKEQPGLGEAMSKAWDEYDPKEAFQNAISGNVESLYRMVRNIPVAGPFIDKANVKAHEMVNRDDNFAQRQKARDQEIATQNPVQDILEKSLPWLATAPYTIKQQLLLLGTDLYERGIFDGKSNMEAAQDAAEGVAIGIGAMGVGKGLEKVAAPLAHPIQSLRELANQRAVKAATGQSAKHYRNQAKTTLDKPRDIDEALGTLEKAGKNLIEEPGLINYFDTAESIAPKAAEARRRIGSQIGMVGDELDAINPKMIDTKNIAENILKYAAEIPETSMNPSIIDALTKEAAHLEKMGGMSFKQAQAYRGQFPWDPRKQDSLYSNKDAIDAINMAIGEEMEAAVARALQNPAIASQEVFLSQYPELKKKYGAFAGAAAAGSDRVLRNMTNRWVSPSDQGHGLASYMASAATGSTAPEAAAHGMAHAAANKFARTRGSAFVARGSHDLANFLEARFGTAPTQTVLGAKLPIARIVNSPYLEQIMRAAAEGQKSLAITHYMLSNSDPEYQALLKNGEDGGSYAAPQ